MVRNLSRASLHAQKDPHDWNSWDHYLTIHETRLSQHPFIADEPDTLSFEQRAEEVYLSGWVYCQKNVVLQVEKWFDTRHSGNTVRVRCHTYVYIAWLPGQHLLLKYHNLHRDRDEYHHRIYNPATGEEIFHEILERRQFPTFSEVLDELQVLTQDL